MIHPQSHIWGEGPKPESPHTHCSVEGDIRDIRVPMPVQPVTLKLCGLGQAITLSEPQLLLCKIRMLQREAGVL